MSEKTKEMEEFLDKFALEVFGHSRKDNACVTCASEKVNDEDFRDDLSKKEYKISKMCQSCQDETFNDDYDDEEIEEI